MPTKTTLNNAVPGGSLRYVTGTVVGSELIGQNFSSPGYFHERPSAVNYDASGSGGSNYGATSAALMDQVKQRVAKVRSEDNLSPNASVPADLVLASGSGWTRTSAWKGP
jgi:K+-transporting ATPase ATPase C chain